MKTIAIFNQKGGTGKTATAHALASGLTHHGYKVLAADLDAQTNFSYAAGINTAAAEVDIYSLFTGEAEPAAAITTTAAGFDMIPGTTDLSSLDTNSVKLELQSILMPIKENYDFCIIDSPPQVGFLPLQALKAADSVIIPIEADIFSLQGLTQVNETIRGVQREYNPCLKIEGVLLTKYDGRATMNRNIRDALQEITKQIGAKAFATPIRQGIAIKKAMYNQQNLFTDFPKEKVTADYTALIQEIIGGKNNGEEK